MTYFELQFIKAEALFKKGDKAKHERELARAKIALSNCKERKEAVCRKLACYKCKEELKEA